MEDLQRYYEKYYQDEGGHYQKQYSNDELTYIRNEARLAARTLLKFDMTPGSLLDLDGEGYFSNIFTKRSQFGFSGFFKLWA